MRVVRVDEHVYHFPTRIREKRFASLAAGLYPIVDSRHEQNDIVFRVWLAISTNGAKFDIA